MRGSTEKQRIICIHEDRADCLIGVKLTVLSLLDHCPDVSVIVSCPNPPASFNEWAQDLSGIRIVSDLVQ